MMIPIGELGHPEDLFIGWLEHQPHNCVLYPMRDCPGCAFKCARIGIVLGELHVIFPHDNGAP